MLWENLREEEFPDAIRKSKGLCIVPVGCLEKHGQHLPVGTDVIQAAEIARMAAETESACVFPPLYFGEKTGAGEFYGTVMLSERLRMDLLREICLEIHRNGFTKILFFNGHGGNTAMLSQLMRSLLQEKHEFLTFSYALGSDFPTPKKLLAGQFDYLTKEDRKILQAYVEEKKRFGHACFIETGWIYGVRPETVRLDKMFQESGSSTHRFDDFSAMGIDTPFSWMANYPNSYAGDGHEGMNDRIARAMVEYSVKRLCGVIKFLKNETVSDEYLNEWLSKQK